MPTNVQQVLVTDAYTSGEKPRPFTVKMDENDINFSGFTLKATYEDNDGTELTFAGAVVWDDQDTGVIKVTLGEDDLILTSGVEHETRRLMIWTGNAGTQLLATLLIKVPINSAVGTPPSI